MNNNKRLYVLVSQSGESGEIVKLIGKIRNTDQHSTTWGITNGETSTLARGSQRCMDLKAGRESSVTSKTYCNTVLAMYLLASTIRCKTEGELAVFLKQFALDAATLATSMTHILETRAAIGDKMVEFLGKDVKFIEIIGRGASLATAMQAALNIKEMNKIPAEAISGGQFRHGPIEMINKDFRCIVLSSDPSMENLVDELSWNITHKWGGGKVLLIANKAIEHLDGEPRISSWIHDIENPCLAPIIEATIIQLLMIKLALANQIEPGVFKYSAKITKDG